MSSGKWLILGEILVGSGGALVIAVATIALQGDDPALFWGWPSVTGIVVGLAGIVCVVVGLIRREGRPRERRLVQRQQGGAGSANFQAGRDIRTGDR